MDLDNQEHNSNAVKKWGKHRWVLLAAAVATLLLLVHLSVGEGPISPGLEWFYTSWGASFPKLRFHQKAGLSNSEGGSAKGALPSNTSSTDALYTSGYDKSTVQSVFSSDENHPLGQMTPPPDPVYFAPPSPGQGWPPSNKLSSQMLDFNKRGPWRNSNAIQSILIASMTPATIPIVIYVHNRPAYLREVLTRLSRVEGIEESLLIVSHDGYFAEVVAVVREFTFMRIKQARILFCGALDQDEIVCQATGRFAAVSMPRPFGNLGFEGRILLQRSLSVPHHPKERMSKCPICGLSKGFKLKIN